MQDNGAAAIVARSVSKTYGATRALNDVNLSLESGQIHALVGQNGAGKSTFLGALAGRVEPDEGEVSLFGQPAAFGDPRKARALGVAAIYQELTIVPQLSAVANLFLGRPRSRYGILTSKAMLAEYTELCQRFEVAIPPQARAGDLSTADQQMIEIMRGVGSGADLLLFDEPTTSLAPPEREALFRVMSQLRASGKTMVLVSHNLEEVLEICDTVTVFRDGQRIESAPRDTWTKARLVRTMVGHDVAPSARAPRPKPPKGAAPVLTVHDVTLPGACEGITFSLGRGEILGIGGLVGSGRSSLLRSLAGLEPDSSGAMIIDGVGVSWPNTPRQSMRHGLSLVPEDRKRDGLVLGMRVMDNMSMPQLRSFTRFGLLSDQLIQARTAPAATDFGLAPERIHAIAKSLSGGNQQKALLAKACLATPRVLLVDEPTRGIDIGAKEEIMATLTRLSDEGMSIIVVSSELEELTGMCDRVVVLSHGHQTATLDRSAGEMTVQHILKHAFEV